MCMALLSIPLSPELTNIINNLVKRGIAANKADAVRKAIISYSEEQAVLDVLTSEQESREGKVLSGNLRELAKRMR
jgi:Arc/MetJ-type ribon-helix-helix transcriptional regulator